MKHVFGVNYAHMRAQRRARLQTRTLNVMLYTIHCDWRIPTTSSHQQLGSISITLSTGTITLTFCHCDRQSINLFCANMFSVLMSGKKNILSVLTSCSVCCERFGDYLWMDIGQSFRNIIRSEYAKCNSRNPFMTCITILMIRPLRLVPMCDAMNNVLKACMAYALFQLQMELPCRWYYFNAYVLHLEQCNLSERFDGPVKQLLYYRNVHIRFSSTCWTWFERNLYTISTILCEYIELFGIAAKLNWWW